MKESMGVILFVVGILIAEATVLIILLTRHKKKSNSNSNSQAYGLNTNTCSGNGQMVCKCNPGWTGANCDMPETTTAYFVTTLDCKTPQGKYYGACEFTPGSIGRQGGPCDVGMSETECCSSVPGQDVKSCAEVLITDTNNPACYNGGNLSPTCFLDQESAINYAKNLSNKCQNVYPEPVGCW